MTTDEMQPMAPAMLRWLMKAPDIDPAVWQRNDRIALQAWRLFVDLHGIDELLIEGVEE